MENSIFAFSLIMNLSMDHNEPNEHLMNAQKILSKKSRKNFSLRVIVAEQPLVLWKDSRFWFPMDAQGPKFSMQSFGLYVVSEATIFTVNFWLRDDSLPRRAKKQVISAWFVSILTHFQQTDVP